MRTRRVYFIFKRSAEQTTFSSHPANSNFQNKPVKKIISELEIVCTPLTGGRNLLLTLKNFMLFHSKEQSTEQTDLQDLLGDKT